MFNTFEFEKEYKILLYNNNNSKNNNNNLHLWHKLSDHFSIMYWVFLCISLSISHLRQTHAKKLHLVWWYLVETVDFQSQKQVVRKERITLHHQRVRDNLPVASPSCWLKEVTPGVLMWRLVTLPVQSRQIGPASLMLLKTWASFLTLCCLKFFCLITFLPQ